MRSPSAHLDFRPGLLLLRKRRHRPAAVRAMADDEHQHHLICRSPRSVALSTPHHDLACRTPANSHRIHIHRSTAQDARRKQDARDPSTVQPAALPRRSPSVNKSLPLLHRSAQITRESGSAGTDTYLRRAHCPQADGKREEGRNKKASSNLGEPCMCARSMRATTPTERGPLPIPFLCDAVELHACGKEKRQPPNRTSQGPASLLPCIWLPQPHASAVNAAFSCK